QNSWHTPEQRRSRTRALRDHPVQTAPVEHFILRRNRPYSKIKRPPGGPPSPGPTTSAKFGGPSFFLLFCLVEQLLVARLGVLLDLLARPRQLVLLLAQLLVQLLGLQFEHLDVQLDQLAGQLAQLAENLLALLLVGRRQPRDQDAGPVLALPDLQLEVVPSLVVLQVGEHLGDLENLADLLLILRHVVLLQLVQQRQQLGDVLLDEEAGGRLALLGEARQRRGGRRKGRQEDQR